MRKPSVSEFASLWDSANDRPGTTTIKTIDLTGIVYSDPEIMGGTPVFVGTRVPSLTLRVT